MIILPKETPGLPVDALKAVVNLLADLTEAFTVALFLKDAKGEKLKAALWHTFSDAFLHGTSIALGEGLVGYVAKHGTTVDVDRYQREATGTGMYGQDVGIKAFLAVPVGDFGVLVVDTKKRQIFGEREKKIIRQFADLCAHLLIQKETTQRETMYGRILDLQYEVENASISFNEAREYYANILKAGRNFFGLNMGFICRLLPGHRQFMVEAVEGGGVATLRGRSFPLTQGLVGWVFREIRPLSHSCLTPVPGKSFLISPEEPMRGYNTFVGVPLLAWRRLLGVWAFAGRGNSVIHEEEERALLLAGQRVAATMIKYHLENGE